MANGFGKNHHRCVLGRLVDPCKGDGLSVNLAKYYADSYPIGHGLRLFVDIKVPLSAFDDVFDVRHPSGLWNNVTVLVHVR